MGIHSTFQRVVVSTAGLASFSLVTLLVAGPAFAEDSADAVLVALEQATSLPASGATDILNNVAEIHVDVAKDEAVSATVSGTEFEIPVDAEGAISIAGRESAAIGVSIPFQENASDAASVTDGVVAFDNGNETTTVPVIKTDGSLQIATIIDSAEAPTEFDYQFELPENAEIVDVNGSILFLQGENLIGGLAPAWAKDADGRSVPTAYEIRGQSIIQHVDHQGSQFSYPVVADPWIGISLFSRISVDSYKNQPRVNLDLSPWGWAVYSGVAQGGGPRGFAAGQAILNMAGWSEAWGTSAAVRGALDKPSQRQQFSCHALGAIAAGQWNLEMFRPNRTNGDWMRGVAIHHCNWEAAGGY